MSDHTAAKKEAEGQKSQFGAMVAIVAVSLVVFMALYVPTGPLKKYRLARMTVESLRGEMKVTEMAKQAEEARLLAQDALMDRLNERQPGFDLWTFLKNSLSETGIEKANLSKVAAGGRDDLAQHVTMVKMQVSGISLEQLVNLLHRIYASNNLIVLRKLEYLRAASDGHGLECSLIFLSPNAPGAAGPSPAA